MVEQVCVHCGHNEFAPKQICAGELYNKKGEFVEGYGHTPIFINRVVSTEQACVSCGFVVGRDPAVVLPSPNK